MRIVIPEFMEKPAVAAQLPPSSPVWAEEQTSATTLAELLAAASR